MIPRLAFLIGMIWFAGCAGGVKPVTFNNNVGRAMRQLGNAGTEFSKTISPLSYGKAVSGQEARAAYNKMETALKEALAEQKKMGSPKDGGETGEKFSETYVEFLKSQQTCLDKAREIVEIIEGNSPNKWGKIQPLLTEVDDAEAKAMTPMREAQKEYCKTHNLSPK
jgi:hypothetical protein